MGLVRILGTGGLIERALVDANHRYPRQNPQLPLLHL
jgi:hypothetical protein